MTNTEMYVCTLEEFILIDVVTLLYNLKMRYGLEFNWFIYNRLNRHEECENTIHSHLTQKRSENYIQLRKSGY